MLNLSAVTLTSAINAGADPFFLGVAAALHPLSRGAPVVPDYNQSEFLSGYTVGKAPGPIHAGPLHEAIDIWRSVCAETNMRQK